MAALPFAWRLAAVVAVSTATLLAGGVIYGYQALLPPLLDEGAAADLCGSESRIADSDGFTCLAQRLRLTLLYTASMSGLFLFVAVFGPVMDRIGTHAVLVLGVCMVAGGAVLLATPGSSSSLTAGLLLLGVGSPAVFTPGLALPYVTFPKRSGIVASAVICLFDASAGVTTVLAWLNDDSGPALPWTSVMYGFAIACVSVGMLAVLLFPKPGAADEAVAAKPEPEGGDAGGDQSDDEEEEEEEEEASPKKEALFSPLDTVYERASGRAASQSTARSISHSLSVDLEVYELSMTDHRPGVRDRLLAAASKDSDTRDSDPDGGRDSIPSVTALARRPHVMAAVLFMCALSLKNSFFIGTLGAQVAYIDPTGEHASDVALAFNVVFPLGGLVSLPISSWLLTVNRDSDHRSFVVVLVLALVHAVLNMLPSITAQYGAVAVFALLRSLKWSVYSDFVIRNSPMERIGGVFGITNIAIGIANLGVYPLDDIVHRLAGGSYFGVNLGLTIVEAVLVVVPWRLWRKNSRYDAGSLLRSPRLLSSA